MTKEPGIAEKIPIAADATHTKLHLPAREGTVFANR